MDVLQPFVPLGNSGTVPRGQRLESALVCLSPKCFSHQDLSGCGALVASDVVSTGEGADHRTIASVNQNIKIHNKND